MFRLISIALASVFFIACGSDEATHNNPNLIVDYGNAPSAPSLPDVFDRQIMKQAFDAVTADKFTADHAFHVFINQNRGNELKIVETARLRQRQVERRLLKTRIVGFDTRAEAQSFVDDVYAEYERIEDLGGGDSDDQFTPPPADPPDPNDAGDPQFPGVPPDNPPDPNDGGDPQFPPPPPDNNDDDDAGDDQFNPPPDDPEDPDEGGENQHDKDSETG